MFLGLLLLLLVADQMLQLFMQSEELLAHLLYLALPLGELVAEVVGLRLCGVGFGLQVVGLGA